MVEWVKGFIVPILKTVVVGGVLIIIISFIYRGFSNAYKKSLKFVLKYQILRRKYPESTVNWVLKCMDKGIGWYDAKKFLLIHGTPDKEINEVMWIYDKMINTMIKGGRNGELKRRNSQTQSTTELPNF